jgi:hypothetical protein
LRILPNNGNTLDVVVNDELASMGNADGKVGNIFLMAWLVYLKGMSSG